MRSTLGTRVREPSGPLRAVPETCFVRGLALLIDSILHDPKKKSVLPYSSHTSGIRGRAGSCRPFM